MVDFFFKDFDMILCPGSTANQEYHGSILYLPRQSKKASAVTKWHDHIFSSEVSVIVQIIDRINSTRDFSTFPRQRNPFAMTFFGDLSAFATASRKWPSSLYISTRISVARKTDLWQIRLWTSRPKGLGLFANCSRSCEYFFSRKLQVFDDFKRLQVYRHQIWHQKYLASNYSSKISWN